MLSCAMYKWTTSTVYICIIVFQSANIDLQVSSSWSGFDETSYKKDKGSYFVPGRFWRIGRIHQFLQIILVCTIYPILQIVLMHNSWHSKEMDSILTPQQKRRPLPLLLYLSFFYVKHEALKLNLTSGHVAVKVV